MAVIPGHALRGRAGRIGGRMKSSAGGPAPYPRKANSIASTPESGLPSRENSVLMDGC
jgi:hypothetical protein